MSSNYIFSLTLIKANIEREYITMGNQIWFNIKCDGSNDIFTTLSAPIQAEVTFNAPHTFTLYSVNLDTSYLFLTLCYFGENGSMLPLGRSKSRIGRLPFNSSSFTIPLMSATSQSKQVGVASFSVKIEALPANPMGGAQPGYSMQPQSPYQAPIRQSQPIPAYNGQYAPYQNLSQSQALPQPPMNPYAQPQQPYAQQPRPYPQQQTPYQQPVTAPSQPYYAQPPPQQTPYQNSQQTNIDGNQYYF